MTRQRTRLEQLRAVEHIRGLQHTLAQSAAMRAAQDEAECAREHQAQARELHKTEAGWRQAVVRGHLGDLTGQAWSAAVVQHVASQTEAGERLASSRAENARTRREWELATLRRDLARESAAKASRRAAAYRDDQRSAELADRYLIGWELP